MKLNVGCGAGEIMDGWVNLDVRDYPGVDVICDVRRESQLERYFGLGEVDEFRCSHVLEHFSGHDFLDVMQNLWQIAKPGARFHAIVPYGMSRHFWRDPDHVRPMFWDSFNCAGQPYWERCDLGYRGDWAVKHVALIPEKDELDFVANDPDRWIWERANKLWNCVSEMHVMLEAVKPLRDRVSAAADGWEFHVGVGVYREEKAA